MKINRLEAHDRLEHLTKQSFGIEECCQNLVDQRPFGEHAFYIFAHTRTHDDGVSKRLIWQPRLTKPVPETNSMLFKGYPGTDQIKICWMIPAPEMWAQYKKGNVTEHDVTSWSINQFMYNKEELARKEPDDLPDAVINSIYKELQTEALFKKSGMIHPKIMLEI